MLSQTSVLLKLTAVLQYAGSLLYELRCTKLSWASCWVFSLWECSVVYRVSCVTVGIGQSPRLTAWQAASREVALTCFRRGFTFAIITVDSILQVVTCDWNSEVCVAKCLSILNYVQYEFLQQSYVTESAPLSTCSLKSCPHLLPKPATLSPKPATLSPKSATLLPLRVTLLPFSATIASFLATKSPVSATGVDRTLAYRRAW